MMPSADIDYYAIRRVNPFLGVLQIIDTIDGRASSTNGLSWEIQLRIVAPPAWGSLNSDSPSVEFYRYGLWSAETGLVSWPMSVIRDASNTKGQCERLITCLEKHISKLPFPLQDNRELWLLDEEKKLPLALLATLRSGELAPRPEPRYWSGCLGKNGAASQGRFPQIEALETQVKHRAGFNLDKRWFTRSNNSEFYSDVTGNQIPASAFPPLLLSIEWPDTSERDRASSYLQWIAPALLTLPELSDDLRTELESQLSARAVCIEHQWRLYPKILDQEKINASRIQSKLLASNQPI